MGSSPWCQHNYLDRLGHVKKTMFFPWRMPLAIISSRRVNIWYRTDPRDQWKRVTRPVYFFNGLRLSLGSKLVSTNNSRSSYPSKTSRPFPSGGEKKDRAAFCTNRLKVLQGVSLYIFSPRIRRSDLPVFNMKQNLAKKKLDHTVKSRNL